MPDLHNLLENTILDEIEIVEMPEGYWEGEIVSGKHKKLNRDDETFVDKNGKTFTIAEVYVRVSNAIDAADEALAQNYLESGAANNDFAKLTDFIYSVADAKKLSDKLAACGAMTTGRTLDQILEGLKGANIPVKVLIVHEEYNGDTQYKVDTLVPLD